MKFFLVITVLAVTLIYIDYAMSVENPKQNKIEKVNQSAKPSDKEKSITTSIFFANSFGEINGSNKICLLFTSIPKQEWP